MSVGYDRFRYFWSSRQKMSICQTAKKPPPISLFSLPQTPVKVGKGKSQKKTIRVVFAAASTYTVLEAATTCTQSETFVQKITAPIQGKLDLRDCLHGSAEPVFGELSLWTKSHPYSVRFCKSLDVNLTEITANYPLMKIKSMNLILAVPGGR